MIPFLRKCLSKQTIRSTTNFRLVSALDFPASLPESGDLNDGQLAIIDQIIAAHARLFLGTCDSTFTMRIQEDRELLGHFANTTYNCFCSKQEQTMREDYGRWSKNGPCFVLRPWRMVQTDKEFFQVAFDHKPYVFTNNQNTLANQNSSNVRTGEEL